MFLNSYQGEELLNVYHQGAFALQRAGSLGRVGRDEGAINRHLSKVIAAADRQAIAALHPRVVVDSCNGAGSEITGGLLEMMGCEVIAINDVPDGHFPRDPEPMPENLGQLCEAVREHRADLGFAQDADADRLAIVAADGEAISEEFTLAFACDVMAENRSGPLVTNLSTSRMIDEVGERRVCSVLRTTPSAGARGTAASLIRAFTTAVTTSRRWC